MEIGSLSRSVFLFELDILEAELVDNNACSFVVEALVNRRDDAVFEKSTD